MENFDASEPTPSIDPNSEYSRQQKIGLWFLLFLILIILGFWYLSVRVYITKSLYGSFNPAQMKQDQINQQKLLENQQKLNDAYSIDTDKDGLADWDEINVQGTSPYLEDTDGDLISDKDEVVAGTNALCPEGKQCTGSLVNDLIAEEPASQQQVPTVSDAQSELMRQAFGEKPDPNFLRQHLLDAATDEEQKAVIQKLTDEQMIQFYEQMVSGDLGTSASSTKN
jgi:hypothetical protein